MRPSRDAYFLELTRLIATRSTCLRRAVGCVLVNARGHVLATGYNGVAAGLPHCNESFYEDDEGVLHDESIEGAQRLVHPRACVGAFRADGKRWSSGKNLEGCEAIHAEQNALLQCRDVWEIDTAYVTVSPCLTCVKLLLNTACRRIAFTERYAAPHHDAAASLWQQSGKRSWIKLD